MTELLFSTAHGSHLYGTSHAGSDHDTFEVYENKSERTKARYAKQTIKGDQDVLKTDLSTFTKYAREGVPQYLEAMYSRNPVVDKLGENYRLTFKPDLWETIHKYRRTITAFYERGVEEQNLKFRKHAWRLMFNLRHIEQGEIFNPTLTWHELRYIDRVIMTNPLDFYGYEK